MSGKLIVISGPSGVGKTTLCSALLSYPEFHRVVTATSRPPRHGEQNGIEYHFLTETTFREWLERGEFLENARVHGHLYGTPRREVEASLRQGKQVLLNIDIQGARQIRKAAREFGAPGCYSPGSAAGPGLPLVMIFIMPPSMEVLEERLSSRGTEDPSTARMRIETAREELKESSLYEHVVVNDVLETAVEEILNILGYKDL